MKQQYIKVKTDAYNNSTLDETDTDNNNACTNENNDIIIDNKFDNNIDDSSIIQQTNTIQQSITIQQTKTISFKDACSYFGLVNTCIVCIGILIAPIIIFASQHNNLNCDFDLDLEIINATNDNITNYNITNSNNTIFNNEISNDIISLQHSFAMYTYYSFVSSMVSFVYMLVLLSKYESFKCLECFYKWRPSKFALIGVNIIGFIHAILACTKFAAIYNSFDICHMNDIVIMFVWITFFTNVIMIIFCGSFIVASMCKIYTIVKYWILFK